MALCFFCYDASGDVSHIHEQNDLPSTERDRAIQECSRIGAAARGEEISLEILCDRLLQIPSTVLDRALTKDVMERFSVLELRNRRMAAAEEIEVSRQQAYEREQTAWQTAHPRKQPTKDDVKTFHIAADQAASQRRTEEDSRLAQANALVLDGLRRLS